MAEARVAAAEPEPEPAPSADGEVAAIRAGVVRRASVGSASTGGEWWSAHGSSDGDMAVSGARGGSAPCGPVAWWPQTTVFKRRDSLVTLLVSPQAICRCLWFLGHFLRGRLCLQNDKTISADERKAKRATRSRNAERNAASAAASREAPLHVKHYGKSKPANTALD